MKQNKFVENVISLSDFELSGDQLSATELFAGFLEKDFSSGLSVFVLAGYAGTGKSTLTSLLNRALRQAKMNT